LPRGGRGARANPSLRPIPPLAPPPFPFSPLHSPPASFLIWQAVAAADAIEALVLPSVAKAINVVSGGNPSKPSTVDGNDRFLAVKPGGLARSGSHLQAGLQAVADVRSALGRVQLAALRDLLDGVTALLGADIGPTLEPLRAMGDALGRELGDPRGAMKGAVDFVIAEIRDEV